MAKRKTHFGTLTTFLSNSRIRGEAADVYFGRDTAIIERRKKIKKLTIKPPLELSATSGLTSTQGEPDPPLNQTIN
jgi:hypothetical protein